MQQISLPDATDVVLWKNKAPYCLALVSSQQLSKCLVLNFEFKVILHHVQFNLLFYLCKGKRSTCTFHQICNEVAASHNVVPCSVINSKESIRNTREMITCKSWGFFEKGLSENNDLNFGANKTTPTLIGL